MALFRRTKRLLVVELNAHLMPLDRGEHFEDPLDEHLTSAGLPASVTGGGTLTGSDGEPVQSDIEVTVTADSPVLVVAEIALFLTSKGAPKGSRITDAGKLVTDFGTHEGLGLYLNGTDLPAEVYADSDVNDLVAAVREGLADAGRLLSCWEGSRETALYLYGPSAAVMRERLEPVLPRFPLAQQSRLVDLT